MTSINKLDREWLEADGLGGFASGTVGGQRTRRYHALLLVATTPPTGRYVLLNGIEAWVTTPSGTFAISTQHYEPNVTYPDGFKRIESFTIEPWPTWRFRIEDGTEIEQTICVPRDHAGVTLSWQLIRGHGPVELHVRPLVSGRDQHTLHRANSAFNFRATIDSQKVEWRPYAGVPATTAWSNGQYQHAPLW
jgi:predicted glycogen debranching enzyme